MDIDGKIYSYPTMSMALNQSHLLELHRELIDELRKELAEFKNEKNWTRSYNAQGDLIPEFALYIPRLPHL